MRLLLIIALIGLWHVSTAQIYPTRPNAYSSDSLRNGEWITFYDSLGVEVSRESIDISHYCLMKIKNGKPLDQVECFYENGIRSWSGRMVTIDPEIKQGRALGYHKNGALWSRVTYENDTVEGFYQSFHSNGILEAEGQMIKGKRVGDWSFFYDNGNPIGTIGHIDGKENGHATISYPNGNINSKGELIDNEQNGYWETYFESGVLANKGDFVNGKREGEWTYYNENGGVLEIGHFENDQKNGIYKYYHPNGHLQSKGIYKDGLGEGYFEYYFENGQLEAKGILSKHLYQGNWVFYHENGVKNSEGEYKDDLNEGLWNYYFENEQFNRQVHYKNGKANGPVTYYHRDGKFNATGKFIEDEKDGVWEYYFENGVKQGAVSYKAGIRQGPSQLGNDQGNLISKGVYHNGKKIGFWEFYNEDGSPYSAGEYQDDLQHGYMTFYYDSGEKKNEGEYQNDLREGEWTYYHRNGIPSAIGNYSEGNSVGHWVYYYDNGSIRKEGEEHADSFIGEWLFYGRNGRLNSKGSYEDGLLHGPHFFYDSLGGLAEEGIYFEGTKQNFINLYDSVDRLTLRGDFEKGWKTLASAEKAFYKEYKKDALKKADLLELYGVFYNRKREFKKAEKYYKKSLRHTLKHEPDTSDWYTSTLDNLADVYTGQKEYEKAHNTYQKVIEKIKARPNGQLSDEYASSFRYLTITLMNLNRHGEAVELLKKDLEFRLTIPGQKENIAGVHFSIIDGLYPKITPELDSALANSFRFHKENELENYWSYPSTHYYQALVYRDKNMLDSAYKHFEACVNRNIAQRDTVNIETVNSLIHLGNYHYINLQYDLSRPYFRRANVIAENPKIRSSWIYLGALKSLATQSWADDDYPNTLKYNSLVVDVAKRDNSTFRLGQGYTGMALAYDNMGNDFIKDAKENHLNAIETLGELKGYSSDFVNANLHYTTHLINQGKPQEAHQIFKEMEQYLLNQSEIDSFYLYRTYNSMAYNFYDQYAYDSAEYYANKIIAALEKNPERKLKQYLESYRLKGDIAGNLNQDELASTYYFKELSETERLIGTENEFYYHALIDVAESFANQSNATSAIKYYQDAIELSSQVVDVTATLSARISLAEQYISIENFEQASNTLDFVKQTRETNNSANTGGYIWCLRMFSRLYEEQDDLKTAEEYILRALEIGEEIYRSNSQNYANLIRRVGQFYLRNNEYEQAYQYVAPAIEIVKNTLGDEVVLYAWYAETMSRILYGLDDYAQAVNLQEKAANIYLNQIGEEQDYMDAQFKLGELLAQLGQNERSIEALEKSRNAVINKYGRYSLAYTTDTKEIAFTYLLWKKPEKALESLIEVKNLYDSIGVRRSYYASLSSFMGWAHFDLKNDSTAKKYYQESIQIADSTWGSESGASQVYRNNFAFYYMRKGEFAEAEALWLAVEDHFNTTDLSSVSWLDNMAMLYTSWNKLEKAGNYWDLVTGTLLSKIKGDFPLLSEHGKAAFWDAYKKDFEIYNTYAIKGYQSGNRKALGQMYDNQLQTKSLLLNSTTKERKRILNSGNKSLISTYNKYVDLKENLVRYYGYTTDQLKEEGVDIEALEEQAESFEKALSINSLDEKNANNERTLSWKSIQRTLLPDEAAIELIRFRYFDKTLTDSIIYAALILTPETRSSPILQLLPNGNYLEDRGIKAYRSAIKFKVEDKRSYDSFWKSIDQHLTGVKNIYLSSDGVFHQMNIATLQRADGSFISDTQEFRLISSTRALPELKKRTRKNENYTAYIFGNPKFDLSHTLIETELKERGLTNTQSFTRATTLDDFSFTELPGTKIETETVNEVLSGEKWTTNLYLQEEALEEELKRVNKPGLLHIATHGFFLDQPDETSSTIQLGIQAEASRKNALLRSGLLMTGATQTAKGEQNSVIENGIFTAYEAMNLDLSSTELVVLSACETGLGEIKNGEGVFGLQRAFQIAGAKSILMSLWKVDDAATQLLMTSFYKEWLSGASETDALHYAQEVVKKSYPHPNYWGAFVLVGG